MTTNDAVLVTSKELYSATIALVEELVRAKLDYPALERAWARVCDRFGLGDRPVPAFLRYVDRRPGWRATRPPAHSPTVYRMGENVCAVADVEQLVERANHEIDMQVQIASLLERERDHWHRQYRESEARRRSFAQLVERGVETLAKSLEGEAPPSAMPIEHAARPGVVMLRMGESEHWFSPQAADEFLEQFRETIADAFAGESS